MTTLMEAIDAAPQQDADTTLGASWLLGFDTETTGTYIGKDAIVSATLVLRNPSAGSGSDSIGEWIINPHHKMNPRASEINGFTDEFLAEHGEEPVDALDSIAAVIAAAQRKSIPLLAYNAPFDVHMLAADLERWQLRTVEERTNSKNGILVVDPLVIDRSISHRSGKRTLTYTTEYYGVEPSGDFHDATSDTIAAVDLIRPMSTLYPQVGRIALGDLMDWQRQAHASWRDSYNEWLRKHGRRTINDSWL